MQCIDVEPSTPRTFHDSEERAHRQQQPLPPRTRFNWTMPIEYASKSAHVRASTMHENENKYI